MKKYMVVRLLAGCAALAVTPAAYAKAAEAANSATDAVETPAGEIVVSATRRLQSVKDTPLAVSATSGESIQNANVTSIQDLTRLEPSLVVNNQGVAANQFIIRGILSDAGATTGYYIDETAVTGPTGLSGGGDGRPGVRLHDIQRVEVLKGPQGTLFGTGSMAGTIRIITNKPKLGETSGYGSVSVGSIEGGKAITLVDGAVNAPLGETLALRVVGWGELGGGYIDHYPGLVHTKVIKNANNRTVLGGRAQLLWQPIDVFKLTASATYQSAKTDGTQSVTVFSGQTIFGDTSWGPAVDPYSDNVKMFSLTGELDVGAGTVTAIGSYTKQHIDRSVDTTGTAVGVVPLLNAGIIPGACSGGTPNVALVAGGTCPISVVPHLFSQPTDYRAKSAEIRFSSKFEGPAQIVLGAFYEDDQTAGNSTVLRADATTGYASCYGLTECTTLGLRKQVIYAQLKQYNVKQWSIYGQADYELTSQLTATVGMRYYGAKMADTTTNQQSFVTGELGVVDTATPGTTIRNSEHSPSYNFALLYKVNPDVSLYARVGSGFRIGGINYAAAIAAQLGSTAAPASYGSDSLWSYEAGVKGYMLDRKLYGEFGVYQMDWSKMQVSGQTPPPGFTYYFNASKVRVKGVEASLNYNDGPLSLQVGGTYTDSRLAADLPAAAAAGGTFGSKGDRVPRVPQWNISGQGRYEAPLGDNRAVYFQGNFSYRSSSTYSWSSKNAFNTTLPGYWLFGASLGYKIQKFDVAAFVDNIGNVRGVTGMFQNADGIRKFVTDPRTFGVRARFDF